MMVVVKVLVRVGASVLVETAVISAGLGGGAMPPFSVVPALSGAERVLTEAASVWMDPVTGVFTDPIVIKSAV